jgi:hypothetical protein
LTSRLLVLGESLADVTFLDARVSSPHRAIVQKKKSPHRGAMLVVFLSLDPFRVIFGLLLR